MKSIRYIIFILISCLMLASFPSQAYCFSYAAARFGVDADILRAIARAESSMNPDALNVNKNNSYDIGMMQINSIHEPVLKKAGLSLATLSEPCTNVIVGAWLLKGATERAGGDIWHGVGNYHSVTPKHHNVYISKVRKAFEQNAKEKIAGKGK